MWNIPEYIRILIDIVLPVVVVKIQLALEDRKKKYSTFPSAVLRSLCVNQPADISLNKEDKKDTDAYFLSFENPGNPTIHLISLQNFYVKQKTNRLLIKNTSQQDFNLTLFLNEKALNIHWEYERICSNQKLIILYHDSVFLNRIELSSYRIRFSYRLNNDGDIEPQVKQFKKVRTLTKLKNKDNN